MPSLSLGWYCHLKARRLCQDLLSAIAKLCRLLLGSCWFDACSFWRFQNIVLDSATSFLSWSFLKSHQSNENLPSLIRHHGMIWHDYVWQCWQETMRHSLIGLYWFDHWNSDAWFSGAYFCKILVDLTKNLSKSQSHIYDFQMATTCNRGTRTAKSYQAHRCSASGAAIWTQRSVFMIFSRSCSRPHPCLKVFPLPL